MWCGLYCSFEERETRKKPKFKFKLPVLAGNFSQIKFARTSWRETFPYSIDQQLRRISCSNSNYYHHVLCMSISAWREMMLTPPPEFHMRCLYVGLNVGIVSTFKFEKGRNEKVTYCRSSSSPTIEQRTNQQHAHHGTMAHGHDHGDFRPTEPIIVGARPTTDGEDLWYQIPCT